MTKKYTIKDIAKLAGVSKGTVDRVLHKRGKVSEDALKKINDILSKIDYRPNPIAKTLKSNKVYQLSLIIPDVTQDSFWSPCLNAVNEVKEKYQNFGISIEITTYSSKATNSFLSVSKQVIKSNPDAILMVPLFYKEALKIAELCKTKEIVLSTFNNTIKDANHVNFIGQDLYKSGRVAAKLFDTLLSNGNILLVHIDQDFDNATHMQAKEKGFRDYFTDKNTGLFHINTLNINHNKTEKSLNQLELYAEDKELDGIFVTTSKTYIAGLFKEKTKKKIKIVGYDLIDENNSLLKKGNIDFLINQNPRQQTFLGLSQLAEYFLFETHLPKETLLPIGIINSENLEQYLQ